MDKIRQILLLTFILLLLMGSKFSMSQGLAVKTLDSVDLTLSGTLQPRFTYAEDNFMRTERQTRLGFGLRRARLILDGSVGQNFHFFVQYEAVSRDNRVSILDARVTYDISPQFSIRLGRFVGAEPRAFAITSHRYIDGANRAYIAEKWGKNTIGADGRDYGIEGRFKSKRWELRAFLHNGYNMANFNSNVSSESLTGGITNSKIAGSFYAAYQPVFWDKFEIGGFAGFNNNANPNTDVFGIGEKRTYYSYSGHIYWGGKSGDNPFRVKGDFIAINYEETENFIAHYTYGVSGLIAIRPFPFIEFFGRAEKLNHNYSIKRNYRSPIFYPLEPNVSILNAGINFSPGILMDQDFNRNKLTISGALKTGEYESLGNAYLIQAQYQFVF